MTAITHTYTHTRILYTEERERVECVCENKFRYAYNIYIHTNVLLYNNTYNKQKVCVCVRHARKNNSLLMRVQRYYTASTVTHYLL